MLKKLYKHEFYSLFRNLLPVYAALIGLSLVNRLSHLFQADNMLVSALQNISTILYVLVIGATFFVALVIIVVRFYKHLLSHEGYLTFTLPVKPTQHIICKLICGVTVTLASIAAMIGSLFILGAGTDTMKEFLSGLSTGYEMFAQMVGTGLLTVFWIEAVVLVIAYICDGLLMLYASMAIGQQFKNKIGGAVLSYFVIYAILQVIAAVIFGILGLVLSDRMDTIFAGDNLTIFAIMAACYIGYEIVISTAYFLITRYMLNKKLNLE